MTVRIDVYSPKTWGQLGNYLAATRFAATVRDGLGVRVLVHEAERTVPWLGRAGQRMRDLTVDSPDPQIRHRRYQALIRELLADFPAGAEEPSSGAEVRVELDRLVAELAADPPDLVVATKGVVARLCLLAVRRAGLDVPVVSQVTNSGLLRLPIHPSREVDLTLVPFPADADYLRDQHGYQRRAVQVVGPLVARHDVTDAFGANASGANAPRVQDAQVTVPAPWSSPGDPPATVPVVLVFSNRGGSAFSALVEGLARTHPWIRLVFLGLHDPRGAESAAQACGVPHWRFLCTLQQSEYLEYLGAAASTPGSFLVSKAGPNTSLEAAYHGVAVLMLHSGLPMEAWVPDLIESNGFGRCVPDAAALLAVTRSWLDQPGAVNQARGNAVRFSRDSLVQDRVSERICTAIGGLLSRGERAS